LISLHIVQYETPANRAAPSIENFSSNKFLSRVVAVIVFIVSVTSVCSHYNWDAYSLEGVAVTI
jgi:uncharacterized membrane protein